MSDKKEKKPIKKPMLIIGIVFFAIAAAFLIAGAVMLFREHLPYSDLALQFEKKDMSGLVSEEEYNSSPHSDTVVYEPPATPEQYFEILPVKFHFIDRGVECDIYPVTLKDGGMDAVESAKDVSWLAEAPYVLPGENGNCVIAGHNLWHGEQGTFSLLKKMKKGEIVAVTFNRGFTRYFRVESINKNVRYDDKSPMQATFVKEPTLTLITCQGDWDPDLKQSTHRVVVICRPVEHK